MIKNNNFILAYLKKSKAKKKAIIITSNSFKIPLLICSKHEQLELINYILVCFMHKKEIFNSGRQKGRLLAGLKLKFEKGRQKGLLLPNLRRFFTKSIWSPWSDVSCKMSSLPAPERVRIFFTKMSIWTDFQRPFRPAFGPIDPSISRQSEKCKKLIGYCDKTGQFPVCLSPFFEHVTMKDV